MKISVIELVKCLPREFYVYTEQEREIYYLLDDGLADGAANENDILELVSYGYIGSESYDIDKYEIKFKAKADSGEDLIISATYSNRENYLKAIDLLNLERKAGE